MPVSGEVESSNKKMTGSDVGENEYSNNAPVQGSLGSQGSHGESHPDQIDMPEVSIFDSKDFVLEQFKVAVMNVWDKLRGMLEETPVEHISSLQESFNRTFASLHKLDLDISPLETRVEEVFEKARKFDELRSTISEKMSSESQGVSLSTAKDELKNAQDKVARLKEDILNQHKSFKAAQDREAELEQELKASAPDRLVVRASVPDRLVVRASAPDRLVVRAPAPDRLVVRASAPERLVELEQHALRKLSRAQFVLGCRTLERNHVKGSSTTSAIQNTCGEQADEGECDPQLPPANGKRKSVFKRIGKIESQRSVFDRLGSNPQAPKSKSIHDRLGVVHDVKNNVSHPVEAEPSKRPRSMIPSRMRRETDIHISCGEVLKVQPRTIVHTHVHKGENEESVGSSDDVAPPQGEEASSFHITLCDEIPIEGEDAEEAPLELEEGVRAAIDELKEVDLGTPENPRPIFISTLLSNEDEKIYVELLKEYIDVFAWTYKEMPGSTALCFISWICLSTLPLKEETLSAGVSFRFLQISFQTPAIMAIYFDMKESATGRIET
nr:uncharacterized protein LOC109175453 [Ipomoea batatas]